MSLLKCGTSSQDSKIYNNEKENEKEISKSKKTTEKFSESVHAKSETLPGNLLKGFRKTKISEKIKVTEGSTLKPAVSFDKDRLQDDLESALKTKNHDLLREALLRGADPNLSKDKELPLQKALDQQDVEAVSILVEFNVQFHANELLSSVCNIKRRFIVNVANHVALVKELVRRGADVNYIHDKNEPIKTAAYSGNEGVVRFLAENGAHIRPRKVKNQIEQSPTAVAAWGGFLEIVKYLLDLGSVQSEEEFQEVYGYVKNYSLPDHLKTKEFLEEWKNNGGIERSKRHP